MNRKEEFRELLSGPTSKKATEKIAAWVCNEPEAFPDLYSLIFADDNKVSWRAIWACEKLAELSWEWFADKKQELIELLMHTTHGGKKRLLLSILYNFPTECIFSIELLNTCMEWMLSPKEPIAVQALSIKLAYKLCAYEPELFIELKIYLEGAQTDYLSPGVKSTIKNVLQKLKNV